MIDSLLASLIEVESELTAGLSWGFDVLSWAERLPVSEIPEPAADTKGGGLVFTRFSVFASVLGSDDSFNNDN